ncbi:MAG: TIGR04053 family radical SAM/SPASM domain-containing protein [Minicystis sp.]
MGSLRTRARLAVDDHPLLAIWELTQACDLVCAHCRACATTRRDSEELSTEEGKRLIDSVAAMGTPLFILTGGDPAKRDDLVELVAHGVARGLAMALTPSGTPLMTDALVAAVHDAGLSRLAVSVDGPDAATHDAFRGVEGSFAESMRILEAARRVGLPTQVNTSLHGGNVGQVDAMAAMVARVGATLWSVFVVVPTGRAGHDLLLGPRRLERALEHLADLADAAPFDVKTTAAPHFRRVQMQRRSPRARVGVVSEIDEHGVYLGPRGITDGVGIVFVSHRGDIYPSGFMPISAGNVRRDDLGRVYREGELFRQLRSADDLGGKCGICPFRRVCGGSRARAYAATGDPMGEDPLCAYQPKAAAP